MPPKNDPTPFSLVLVDFDATLTIEESLPWVAQIGRHNALYPINFELLQILYEHHTITGVPTQIVSSGSQMHRYIQTDDNIDTCPFFVIEPLLKNIFHYIAGQQDIVDQTLINETLHRYREYCIDHSIDHWLHISQQDLIDVFITPALYNHIGEAHALLCFFFTLCHTSYDIYDAYHTIGNREYLMEKHGKNIILLYAYLQQTIVTGTRPNAALTEKTVLLIDDHKQVAEKAESFCMVVCYDWITGEKIHADLKNLLLESIPVTHATDLEKNPDPLSHHFNDAWLHFIRNIAPIFTNCSNEALLDRVRFITHYIHMPCFKQYQNIHHLYHLVIYELSLLETTAFKSLQKTGYDTFLQTQKESLEHLINRPKSPLIFKRKWDDRESESESEEHEYQHETLKRPNDVETEQAAEEVHTEPEPLEKLTL